MTGAWDEAINSPPFTDDRQGGRSRPSGARDDDAGARLSAAVGPAGRPPLREPRLPGAVRSGGLRLLHDSRLRMCERRLTYPYSRSFGHSESRSGTPRLGSADPQSTPRRQSKPPRCDRPSRLLACRKDLPTSYNAACALSPAASPSASSSPRFSPPARSPSPSAAPPCPPTRSRGAGASRRSCSRSPSSSAR